MPFTNVWQDDRQENFSWFFSRQFSYAAILAFLAAQGATANARNKNPPNFFRRLARNLIASRRPAFSRPFYLSGKIG
jgi:hypothetical protein